MVKILRHSVLYLVGLIMSNKVVIGANDPLNYRDISGYVAPQPSNSTTLLDFINSRSELTTLSKMIGEVGGFSTAFSTNPDWKFTFFAPNNNAFESHLGEYFNTFTATPKGKWWLGNILLHHYVPNSKLPSSSFSETYERLQTATYLYVGSELDKGSIVLNQVANVVESDIPVTNGVVHIIDHILDPSAQIFEGDVSKVSQSFIAGSCSNLDLPYC